MRFDFIKYDEKAVVDQNFLKKQFEALAAAVSHHKTGRAQSLVFTHLEEAFMWVGKMIRDEQIARTKGEAQP